MPNEVEKKYWIVLFSLIGVTLLAWFFVFGNFSKQTLSVSFLDVGQGDAIFIETPHRNQILIDGGPPNKKVLQELRNFMPFYDRHIDLVIATHPDEDHIGGLVDVLGTFQIGLVLDSGLKHSTQAYAKKEALIKEKHIKKISAQRGMKLLLDEGIVLTILFPDRSVEGLDTNDASIIARLTYGEQEFLFTGDAPQKMENYLVFLDGELLRSDVLKVGHHGSKTSTSNEFLSRVSPKYALISAGKENKYGHPHAEVVERLNEHNIEILSTNNLGTITFETDGRSLKIR